MRYRTPEGDRLDIDAMHPVGGPSVRGVSLATAGDGIVIPRPEVPEIVAAILRESGWDEIAEQVQGATGPVEEASTDA